MSVLPVPPRSLLPLLLGAALLLPERSSALSRLPSPRGEIPTAAVDGLDHAALLAVKGDSNWRTDPIFPDVYKQERTSKRHLPPTYYISSEADVARQQEVEQQLLPLATSFARVLEAGDAAVDWCIAEKSCKQPSAEMDQPADWRLELRSALTHRKAIAQAYADGAEAALVVDDSVDFSHVHSWSATLQELTAYAPADWGVLRLWERLDASNLPNPCATDNLFVRREGEALDSKAYFINRAGMRDVLSKPVGSVFDATSTYTLTRPLFGTLAPSEADADAAIKAFFAQAPVCQDSQARQTVAVLTTTFASDDSFSRVLKNAELMATATTNWVLAINAVDNQVDRWYELVRPDVTSKGIYVVARASGRNPASGFESKLVSQLPLFRAIDSVVHTDFFWMVDGDISFLPTDMGLVRHALFTEPYPTIAQLRVQVKEKKANGAQFGWGTQWFQPLNAGQPNCEMRKLPVPAIESQAPLIKTAFLKWYMPALEKAARLQREARCDWGHDEMWCSAASRYVQNFDMGGRQDACTVLTASQVQHDDTRQIASLNFLGDWRNDTGFLTRCMGVVYSLGNSSRGLGRDFLTNDYVNRWWEQKWVCNRLKEDRNAIAHYRYFLAHGARAYGYKPS
eukprot:TRINITY_DN72899_c0_g1_i1.p1 TRINITY_DN72899_c0_g1~~TRINITY_DN72899_c0_g1_i1.p1  ORF type:complete len:626 (-),score=88.06 TRINITY_DN72899_c0_g1_i1:18-1895(-)